MDSPRKRQKLSMDQLDGSSDMPDGASDMLLEEVPANQVNINYTAGAMAGSTNLSHAQNLKEVEVGITEFISSGLPGFTGLFKKRYTDFLVHEVLPSGQVLHLHTLKAPKNPTQNKRSEPPVSVTDTAIQVVPNTSENGGAKEADASAQPTYEDGSKPSEEGKEAQQSTEGNSESVSSKFDPSPDDHKLLESYIGKEITEKVIGLHRRIIRSPLAKPRDHGNVQSAVITDRDLRTKIHQIIRRVFGSRIETFMNADGAIDFSAAPPASKKHDQRSNWGRGEAPNNQRGKLGWNELGGEYLHFTICKENKDTMEVISWIATSLKVNPKNFQFAGTKDRRAVTVQRASIYRVHADRLAGVNRTLRNASIGDYEYQKAPLALGDLHGNEFVITLRDCKASTGNITSIDEFTAIVKEAIESLGQRGYINYFGLQRFGTFSTRTDAVGIHMLKEDFKAACNAILHFDAEDLTQDVGHDKARSEEKARANAIHLFRTTRKAHEALNQLPRKFSAEMNIIKHIGRPHSENDFQGALQMIPRNLRLMYVHAYQSLVWNNVASYRWKLHGDKVVEGDLVMVDEHKQDDTNAEEIDADGEVIVHPAADDSANTQDDIFRRARALTAEEAVCGKYTIFDIVLPTPGFDILYPNNEVAEFYKSFMSSDQGGGLDPLDMRRRWKDISLSGSYRKILSKPVKAPSVRVEEYLQEDKQFVKTDLDILKGKKENGVSDLDATKQDEAVEPGTGPKLAIILTLQLGSSQYATMALRELMKGGTITYKPDMSGGR